MLRLVASGPGPRHRLCRISARRDADFAVLDREFVLTTEADIAGMPEIRAYRDWLRANGFNRIEAELVIRVPLNPETFTELTHG